VWQNVLQVGRKNFKIFLLARHPIPMGPSFVSVASMLQALSRFSSSVSTSDIVLVFNILLQVEVPSRPLFSVDEG
jgi:hypothetical protein